MPRRPRWGHQTSLWQVRHPAFWLFAGIIGIFTVLQVTFLAGYEGSNLGSVSFSLLLLAIFAVQTAAALVFVTAGLRERFRAPVPVPAS